MSAPNSLAMADHPPGGFVSHQISHEKPAAASKLTLILRQERYNADSGFLCEKCAALTYQRMRISESSPEGQLHHENWTRLREAARLGCRLCTFFTVAEVRSKLRPTFYSGRGGPIRVKIEAMFEQRIMCLHMFVPQDKCSAIYYVFLKTQGSPSRMLPQCEIKMCDAERDRLSCAAVNKILGWVRECETEHCSCRRQSGGKLPTRVVDVSPSGSPGVVRLVNGEDVTEREYVALSHCWGMMPENSVDLILKCNTGNIDMLQHGVQVCLLPKLYRDAIHMTRAIKKRYIWIDSLCIVQDSKDDWAIECERMYDVYCNSYLTLSAMSYENSFRGFQEVRPEDVPPQHPICPLPAYPGTYVYARSMVDHESRNDFLKYRGWAFQELLLSPRVLHLTSTAMAFECDTRTVLERGPGSDSLFGYDSGRKRLVYKAAQSTRTKFYDRWLRIVQSYSQLALTYNTDRLPALSGIACFVASQTNDEYIAGLWRKDIVAGLLWYVHPAQPVSSKYIAPTWSWASTAAVWTLDPTRRRFLQLNVVDVHAELATSNPYGEISAASVTVSGPLKPCLTSQLIKKGQRYFVLRGTVPVTVRFALDIGQVTSVRSKQLWCLDCTVSKEEDVAIARTTNRRETFFRPHGLVLERVHEEKEVYKRVGVFEVLELTDDDLDWARTGFFMRTVVVV